MPKGAGGGGNGGRSGGGGGSSDMTTSVTSDTPIQNRIDMMQRLKNAETKTQIDLQKLNADIVEGRIDKTKGYAQKDALRTQAEKLNARHKEIQKTVTVTIDKGRRLMGDANKRGPTAPKKIDLGPA